MKKYRNHGRAFSSDEDGDGPCTAVWEWIDIRELYAVCRRARDTLLRSIPLSEVGLEEVDLATAVDIVYESQRQGTIFVGEDSLGPVCFRTDFLREDSLKLKVTSAPWLSSLRLFSES